jgi:stress response protein SCP2
VHALRPGENISLTTTGISDGEAIQLALVWDPGEAAVDVDASGLILGASRKVRGDDDFVFYNQPMSAQGAVRHLGKVPTEEGFEDRILLHLDLLEDDVTSVVLAASIDGGTFGDLSKVGLHVARVGGERLLAFEAPGASSETAFVLGEVYRRNGEWKVRAVGAGYDSGLAGLAADFGVAVEPEEASEEEAQVEATLESAPPVEVPSPSLVTVQAIEASGPAAAEVVEAAVGEQGAAGADKKPARARGAVKTTKRKPYVVPEPTMAEEPGWRLAPLFSVDGIGSRDEQERRVRSALLATMMGVKEFGRALVGRLGGPAGPVEAYQEVPYHHEEVLVYPDGVLKVMRAGKVWTALVEVKTGTATLTRDQVEKYLEIAREREYDVVVTISNEIPAVAGAHPIKVDGRRQRKTVLLHMSWSEVLTEATMTLSHRGVSDPTQGWILAEFVRYLRNPKTGAAGYDDMGPSWVPMREAVSHGTLGSKDTHTARAVESWNRLVQHLCLRLTGELGTEVVVLGKRKLGGDTEAQFRAQAESLARDACLQATLKVPGAVAPVSVYADLRTMRLDVSIKLEAPKEGRALSKVNWLLRQLADAPGDLRVVALNGSDEARELLGDIRKDPKAFAAALEPERFSLTLNTALGPKRGVGRGGFITSVNQSFDSFYASTVEKIRAWVPPAPRLTASDPEQVDEGPREAPEALGQDSQAVLGALS